MNRLPIVVLLCISLSSFAQNNFVPGFVIKMNSDTVKGFLQEESRKDIVFSISFKPDNNSTVQNFTPSEITAFGYETGDLFKAISFKNTLSDSAQTQTCFALQLVTGSYDLYSYLSKEEIYFVVIGNNSN